MPLARLTSPLHSRLPIDPIQALYWSAVINGVMAAPIIVLMMMLADNSDVMRQFTLSPWLRIVGWITAGVMTLCVVDMFATMGME
jgi:Mn2+/Fe2+ NRAMP family transporter